VTTFSDAAALTLIITGLTALVLPAGVQAAWLILLNLIVIVLHRFRQLPDLAQ